MSFPNVFAANGKFDAARGRAWRFAVRPCDSFGNKGKAIFTDWMMDSHGS